MGSGTWSANTYQTRVTQRKSKGQDAFEYTRAAKSVHPSLDPDGLEMRESRDSTEHPDSNSIIVGLDVSGSMGVVVRGIHADLPQLFKLLLGQGYIPHPQIMFAAFSNGRCDQVPIQVGQFESDNRMDENLENMVMGAPLAGGCDPEESAELMLYVASRHTSIDCWEKRHRKGYLFLISDEIAYRAVKKGEVEQIFGAKLKENIPLEQIIKETSEKYHIYFIIPTMTQSGKNPEVHEFWKSYLDPAHVILLNDPDDISETIALAIGLTERTIRLEEGIEHLRAIGVNENKLDTIAKNLALIAGQSVQGTGLGLGDIESDDTKRTKRL